MVDWLRNDRGNGPLPSRPYLAYAKSQYSCKAGIQLRSLATVLNKLNTSVPPFFTGDIVRLPFPNEERVQKPLQDAYGIFIDSYLYILAHVKKKGISK